MFMEEKFLSKECIVHVSSEACARVYAAEIRNLNYNFNYKTSDGKSM